MCIIGVSAMGYSINERLQRAINRRNPFVTKAASVGGRTAVMDSAVESIMARNYSECHDSAAARMVLVAMSPVDEDCVAKSLEAGENVKKHLVDAFRKYEMQIPTFEYQGSVVANTQIKGASDIDLLVVNERSFKYDRDAILKAYSDSLVKSPPPTYTVRLEEMINWPSYNGNSLDDIRQQRRICEECLNNIYEECDLSKGKSVRILNKGLDQKVDIVNCIWFDDTLSVIQGRNKPYRGIQIYDKKTDRWTNEDYPFLKIQAINNRDNETRGNYKRLIRLLKTFKEDAEGCTHISSFDIYSLLYLMPVESYAAKHDTTLALELDQYLYAIVNQTIDPYSIKGIGCDEYVFRDKKEKFADLRQMFSDLHDVCKKLSRTSRIVYG